MKPRTKIQKEVNSLRHHLRPLKPEQREYIKDRLFPHYMYKTKKNTTCLSCGHRWDNSPHEAKLAAILLGDICPRCDKKLILFSERKRRVIKQRKHICEITTHENYQVFRYFYVERDCKVLKKAKFLILEVQQEWIREKDGKTVDVVRLVNAFNYSQSWQLGSDLEVRRDGRDIIVDKYFPRRKMLKIIRRNGFKGSFHNLRPPYLCHALLSNPMAETLIKTKQIALLNSIGRYKDEINKYWPTIKVAIRHSYTITDTSDWFDHLGLLERFNKDILNPKYVCPENFTADHQRIIDKARRIDNKRKFEEMKAQILKEDIVYQKEKSQFFNLKFKAGDLTVTPMSSVKQFMEEGDLLDHCIYRSEYHKKKHSLIMSARKGNTVLETVQVSLRDFTVLQSRGLSNKYSDHHDAIISLVEQNSRKIKQASKSA
jgi:hypothetical protein